MPRKVSLVAVTTASVTLAAFVTLEFSFGDVFTGSLSSEVSEILAALWGDTAPFVIRLGALAVIYILVAAIGGGLGVLAYLLVKRLFFFLSGSP